MCRKWKKTAALSLAVLIGGMMPMNTMFAAEDNTEVRENTDAPVIDITLNGVNCKVDDPGGDIEYKYFNNPDLELEFSASQNGTKITFSYYLDNDPGDKAKEDIEWIDDCSLMKWTLSSNKSYVVYVKAERNGQTVYARSCGIVSDTIAPKIVGVENGKTYPEGTRFTVEDANPDVVMVNETSAAPESDGNYQVKANGTSCVIRAKDKAGNETVYSINVEGNKTPEAADLISESGVYTLKAGVKYHLAAGNWKIDGDKSVYQGESDFYVKNDGDYIFKK